jgi:hypothetical protein
MGMFLMLLGLAVVVAAMQGVILAYLWRESRVAAAPTLDAADIVGPPQFFHASIGRSPQSPPASVRVPLLLQRLEQHIRLEEEAAESFHQFPTATSLHKHTASPLLH